MSFTTLIAQFSKQAPIATMVRGLMANILSPAELNAIFRETAERQYESRMARRFLKSRSAYHVWPAILVS
jgi:hypothetical protein